MNYKQLVQNGSLENIRIVFISKKSNQFGIGVKYKKDEIGYARSLIPLRSKSGKLIEDTVNVDPITNVAEIPHKLYPDIGNAYSLIERWERGIYVDLTKAKSSSCEILITGND